MRFSLVLKFIFLARMISWRVGLMELEEVLERMDMDRLNFLFEMFRYMLLFLKDEELIKLVLLFIGIKIDY